MPCTAPTGAASGRATHSAWVAPHASLLTTLRGPLARTPSSVFGVAVVTVQVAEPGGARVGDPLASRASGAYGAAIARQNSAWVRHWPLGAQLVSSFCPELPSSGCAN